MKDSKSAIVGILEDYWHPNKAKGLLAQTIHSKEIEEGAFGPDAGEKFFPGSWLLAPKSSDFYKFRFSFFVHPAVLKPGCSNWNPREILGVGKYRPFHAITEFMNNAGIGVVYVVPVTESGILPYEQIAEKNFEGIQWKLFSFQNSAFVECNPREFFSRWQGERGRPGFGREWNTALRGKYGKLHENELVELLLNELFYNGFIKATLKRPINDPYDVDSFLISISQKHIFPMEIKEKFAAENGKEKFFGIDAGRVMMLLRLCLPNDANAIYLIRELNEAGRFLGWKYMTLSDIVMSSSWNLQAGGPGMGGQATQTIRLPYSFFRDFNADAISEENLKAAGSLPNDIKSIAREFGKNLADRFHK